MSIDSNLIVRRDTLPTAAALSAAVAETGVELTFPADFTLDQNVGGWLPMTVDGAETGFDYGVFPLSDWPEDERPEGASDLGDTVLSFGARGSLSAHTVNLIQQVLGRRWRAALWIEDEMLAPEPDFGPDASLADLHVTNAPGAVVAEEDIDPDLAATMRGTPAERAAATQRYVDKFYPPVEPDRKAQVAAFLRPLVIPLIIVAVFIAIFIWTRFL